MNNARQVNGQAALAACMRVAGVKRVQPHDDGSFRAAMCDV